MADFDPTYAKEQILNKTDEELVLIANSTSDEYRQEVIDYAKEELQKRGTVNISQEKAKEIIEQREEHFKEMIGEKEKGLPIKWLWFYTYIRLPLTLIWSLISIFFIPDLTERVISLIIIIPFGILSILVFIGIHKRRIWGWKLNWVLIAVESILFVFSRSGTGSPMGYTPLAALIWVALNVMYFSRRRILFS